MARQLLIELVGDSTKLNKALGDATGQVKTTGDKIKGMSKKAGVGITALGAGLTALGGPLEDATLKLQTVGKQAGFSDKQMGKLTNANGKLAQAQRASGNSSAEVQSALALLIPNVENADDAVRALGVADELAARKGISLQTAAEQVNRALAGGTRVTKEFGIEVGEGEDVLDAMAKTLDGSVSTALQNTIRGRVTAATVTLKDFGAQIGEKIGPALTALGPALIAIGPIMNIAAGATKGLSVAMGFLAANPIVLIIAAIAALAAGLVFAYQKSETFRNIVDGVFRVIKTVIANHPLIRFGRLVVDNFDLIKGAVVSVWNFVKPILDQLGRAIGKVAGPLKALGGAAGKVGGVVGKVGGFVGGIFHEGGVVPGPPGANVPILAQAGETVVPRGGATGGMSVVINVAGSVITERDLGRIFADHLRDNRLVGISV